MTDKQPRARESEEKAAVRRTDTREARREGIPTVEFPEVERDNAGIPTFVFREQLMPTDRPTADNKTLEVSLLWREAILGMKHLDELRPVLVGDHAQNDFRVVAENMPDERYPIVQPTGNDMLVNWTDGMAIEVRAEDGEIYDLDSLKKRGLVQSGQVEGRAVNQYKLGLNDRAAVQIGDVTFVMQYVMPVKSRPKSIFKTMDFYFTKVMVLAIMAHVFTLIAVLITPGEPPGLSEDMFKNPNRIAKLILKEPDKSKKKEKKFELKETKTETTKTSFVTPVRKEITATKGAPRVDPNKRERDREKALNAGIFSALKGAGGGAASKVFGPGGLGTGINNALQGLRGAEMGDAGGAGGLGTRGMGPGGGGSSLGIGGLGDGSGFGPGGPGGGYVDLGGRGKGGYSVIPGRTITKGCLTQEQVGRVINRVHNQAKYCYEKELTRNPNLSGKITTNFVIGPSGAVVSCRITESTMNDKAVEDCLTRMVQRLRFPPCVGGGTAEVTYPWIFKSGGN